MRERLGRHELIGLLDPWQRIMELVVNPDGYTEPHILGRLQDALVSIAQEIGAFQCLKPEVVQEEIIGGVDHLVQSILVGLNEGGYIRMKRGCKAGSRIAESLGCVLLTVADDDLCGQRAPVGVRGHVGDRQACSELVQLRCMYAVVDLGEDELGQARVVHGKTAGSAANALQNLVKAYWLFGAVAFDDVHGCIFCWTAAAE